MCLCAVHGVVAQDVTAISAQYAVCLFPSYGFGVKVKWMIIYPLHGKTRDATVFRFQSQAIVSFDKNFIKSIIFYRLTKMYYEIYPCRNLYEPTHRHK